MTATLKTPILVVGMGRSGLAVLRHLDSLGFERHKDFWCWDQKQELSDFGSLNDAIEKTQSNTLIVSPGVPLALEPLQRSRTEGRHITSEINIGFSMLTTERVIGTTGSLGKSTTVGLIDAGLKSMGLGHFTGGNFGTPLLDYVVDVSTGVRPKATWLNLELSSYQLEDCPNLKLDAAIITYLCPNHMERYTSLNHYYSTKWKMLSSCKGPIVLNRRGGDLHEHSKIAPIPPNTQHVQWVDHSSSLLTKELSSVKLPGDHNKDNAALALALGQALQFSASYTVGVQNFGGLSHRLERLPSRLGLEFINDSKATSIDSVITALQSVPHAARAFVLLGGRDKGLPWKQLKPFSDLTNRVPVYFGECGELAKQQSQWNGSCHASLRAALEFVRGHCKAGDWIVLSPGGTSLDAFQSFEDRGNSFRLWIDELFGPPSRT